MRAGTFGLAQREMVEESQGQGGLDGEIRVAPLPTPPAAPAGRPGSDRLRGQTTPSHRRVERGLGYRPASSQRGTSVLYVGWTFDFIPVVWLLRRVHEKCAPPQGLHATTPCTAMPRDPSLTGSAHSRDQQNGGNAVESRVYGGECRELWHAMRDSVSRADTRPEVVDGSLGRATVRARARREAVGPIRVRDGLRRRPV